MNLESKEQEEKKDEQEVSQPDEGSMELEDEVVQPEGEVASPTEEVAQPEVATMETEEEQQAEGRTNEAEVQELPTPVKQTKKGITMLTRTNPSRKAKKSVTPAVPRPKETGKTSPKARRKVDFSQEVEGLVEQEVGQVEESPNPSTRADPDSIMEENLGDENEPQSGHPDEEVEIKEITKIVDVGKDDEEQTGDGFEEEKQFEMTKALEEERAEMARARIRKAKALPTTRSKATVRKMGGPVIQELSAEGNYVVIESSDESDEEFVQTTSYDRFSDEINEETMDVIRQLKSEKGKTAQGTRKDETKSYGLGHLVDFASLNKLGVYHQVEEKMRCIGWV